jgi:acyl-CoA thioester hydrolase
MGFAKSYFPEDTSFPSVLVAASERRVRFEEVDALGMVWHGRYPSYLEDGRTCFGDTYGLTYHCLRENRTVGPIVQMHLDYKIPLHFDEIMQIETRLHWAEAVRLNFSYIIRNSKGAIAASGYTVQLLTEPDGTVILVVPEWLRQFRKKWRDGVWYR